MPKRHLVLILSEPTEGREDEYNDYYENLHLREVLQTTELLSAQRFQLVDEKGAPCPLPYLALYEAEADDPGEVIRNIDETRRQRQQSEALNKRTAGVWVFQEIGPKHFRPERPPRGAG